MLAPLLAAVLLLAACAGAPRSLAPVPDALPAAPGDYPADAAYVADTIVRAVQRAPRHGAALSDAARASLADTGFDFAGFSVAAHRLLDYRAHAGPGTRTARGSLLLADGHGRLGALLYEAAYRLDDGRIVIDDAFAAPIYRNEVNVKLMLVPKTEVPPLSATWAETWDAMQRLDAMPEDGLRTGHLLGAHALVLFVMERMPPDADLKIDVALSGRIADLPPLSIPASGYRDYDGWRVAIAIVSPGEQADASGTPARRRADAAPQQPTGS